MTNLSELHKERVRLQTVIDAARDAEERLHAIDQVLHLYQSNGSNGSTGKLTRTKTRIPAKRGPKQGRAARQRKTGTFACQASDCGRVFTTAQGAALHNTRVHRQH